MKSYIVLLACFLITSCDIRDELVKAKHCYPMNNDAELYRRVLVELSIPHTYNKSEKCIYGGKALHDRNNEVELKAFGISPPPGLSTTYRDNNEPYIKLLNENGVATTIIKYKGMDYIVWSYDDHKLAEELLGFEPWLKEMHRKARVDAKQ